MLQSPGGSCNGDFSWPVAFNFIHLLFRDGAEEVWLIDGEDIFKGWFGREQKCLPWTTQGMAPYLY